MPKDTLLRLVVRDGELEPRAMTFAGPQITLGKAPYNTVVLSSSYISRHHGEFHHHQDGWYYKDLGSTNGTKLERDGTLVRLKVGRGNQEVLLRGGERLTVGNVRINVELVPSQAERPTEPVIQDACNLTQALTVFDLVPEGNALRLLFDTVQQVSTCTDPSEVLSRVARAAFEAIPSITHLLLFERLPANSGSERWVMRWSRERGGTVDDAPPTFSLTLLDQVIERNESIRVSSVQSSFHPTESLRRARIASTICAPLRGAKGYLGVLQADCRRVDQKTRELQDRDLHLITLLGEQVAMMLDRMRMTRSIHEMFEGFVSASVQAIESRDPPTAGHSERVARYCLRVARAMSLSTEGPFQAIRFNENALRTLRYAALLHDFGKVAVREDVLSKARKLSEARIAEIDARFRLADAELRALAAERKVQAFLQDPAGAAQRLPELDAWLERERAWLLDEQRWLMGQMEPRPIRREEVARLERLTEPVGGVRLLEAAELNDMMSCRGSLTAEERRHIELHAYHTRCYLERIPWSDELDRVPLIAGSHHEKLNGRGYPLGSAGEAVPLEARILTVCDIYDALTASDRPYRTAMPFDAAMRILGQEVTEGGVDGEVLAVLKRVLEEDSQTTGLEDTPVLSRLRSQHEPPTLETVLPPGSASPYTTSVTATLLTGSVRESGS